LVAQGANLSLILIHSTYMIFSQVRQEIQKIVTRIMKYKNSIVRVKSVLNNLLEQQHNVTGIKIGFLNILMIINDCPINYFYTLK